MSKRMKPRSRRQEGAAMFVVLMVILVGTASALFGMHMTTMELRGTGYAGQREKVGKVAESALGVGISYLDTFGASEITRQIQLEAARCNQDPDCGETGTCDTTCPFVGSADDVNIGTVEPPLVAGKGLFRITPEFITPLLGATAAFGVNPFKSEATEIYKPYAMIDYYDNFRTSVPIPGMDLTGRRSMYFVQMKITARARLMLDSDNDGTFDDVSDVTGGGEGNNVAARSARAYVLAGPVDR